MQLNINKLLPNLVLEAIHQLNSSQLAKKTNLLLSIIKVKETLMPWLNGLDNKQKN